MFILSCGRSSVGAVDVERDDGPVAAAVTPLDACRASGGSGVGSCAGSRSDRTDADAPPAPCRRLDNAMSNYDSMATRLKTASRTDFPSLWSVGGRDDDASRKETLTASSVDGEEIPIPELFVGQYQYFCQPLTWSSVFASPGDFTVRVDAAFEQGGEIVLRIAVVCCSVRALKDATASAGTETTKRKSFVKLVERSERELTKFSETMALKYLGHRLMDQLPKLTLSLLTSSRSQLEEYARELTTFLSYVLSITEIGYNRLFVLTEPVAKNLIVREFFDLSLGFGEHGMVSTSSCDARLERRAAEERPLLPISWFNALDGAAHSKSFSLPGRDDSPRLSRPMRSLSGRLSESGYDSKPIDLRSPQLQQMPGRDPSSDGKCIRFIKPTRWSEEKSTPGAFTVEITSVTVSEGRAKYTICVLFHMHGKLEVSTVDRRFSEFDSMVNRIEAKLRAVSIRNHFPTKTLFRYLSVAYLERRAAYLQRFLEKLLLMRFLGLLDQEVTMVAEPNVRKFLNLPSVKWSLTPWRLGNSPHGVHRRATYTNGAEHAHTPPSRACVSSNYTSSPNTHASGGSAVYDGDDLSSPHYFNFSRHRSGSM